MGSGSTIVATVQPISNYWQLLATQGWGAGIFTPGVWCISSYWQLKGGVCEYSHPSHPGCLAYQQLLAAKGWGAQIFRLLWPIKGGCVNIQTFRLAAFGGHLGTVGCGVQTWLLLTAAVMLLVTST